MIEAFSCCDGVLFHRLRCPTTPYGPQRWAIFDIDDTLALVTEERKKLLHRHDHRDANDLAPVPETTIQEFMSPQWLASAPPIDQGLIMLRAARLARYQVLLWTGRRASLRQITHRWLEQHSYQLIRTPSFFRPEREMRATYELKREWFSNICGEVIVFDDDQRVNAMVRDAGHEAHDVRCFDVEFCNRVVAEVVL